MSLDPAKIGDAFQIFGPARRLPEAVVVNVELGSGDYESPPGSQSPGKHYQHYVTATDLSSYRTALDNMRRVGARLTLVNYTPNFALADIDNSFAQSGYWQNVRASYAYGGGAAFDTPPTYFMQNSRTNPYVGELYRRNIAEQIQWLNSRGLRSVVIVSPCGPSDDRGNACGDAYDPKLLENTRALVTYLKTCELRYPFGSAMPSAWVVENYPNKAGNTANRPTGVQGLIAVARLLISMTP